MQRTFFTSTQFIILAVILIAALSVPIVRYKLDDISSMKREALEASVEESPAHVELDVSTSHRFLEDHCFKCHDEDVQKGDLQLNDKLWEFADEKSFDFWKKVYHAVKDDRMPPKKKPAHESVKLFLDDLEIELAQAEENFNLENSVERFLNS